MLQFIWFTKFKIIVFNYAKFLFWWEFVRKSNLSSAVVADRLFWVSADFDIVNVCRGKVSIFERLLV